MVMGSKGFRPTCSAHDLASDVILTVNFIRGLIEPNSPTGFREEIGGSGGSLIIIRGFGKKSSLPEVRIKEEMHKRKPILVGYSLGV